MHVLAKLLKIKLKGVIAMWFHLYWILVESFQGATLNQFMEALGKEYTTDTLYKIYTTLLR